jgi:ribosomal protein L35
LGMKAPQSASPRFNSEGSGAIVRRRKAGKNHCVEFFSHAMHSKTSKFLLPPRKIVPQRRSPNRLGLN